MASLPARLPLLAVWLVACFAAAAVGAIASVHALSFYAELSRPSWTPPPGVFGPVWTLLYTLMAVAAWRVARTPPTPRRGTALALFVAQLLANALWSWLFFAWHLGAAAAVEVLLLLALIAATTRQFARLDRPAAWLMAPYLAWVSFASLLTWTLWRMNPSLLP